MPESGVTQRRCKEVVTVNQSRDVAIGQLNNERKLSAAHETKRELLLFATSTIRTFDKL